MRIPCRQSLAPASQEIHASSCLPLKAPLHTAESHALKSLHNYHSLPWVIPFCHNILNNTLSPSPRYLICVALDSCYIQTTPSLHVPAQHPPAIKNDTPWPSCGNGSLLGRGFLYSKNYSRSCMIRRPEWYCQKSRPTHQGHPNTC